MLEHLIGLVDLGIRGSLLETYPSGFDSPVDIQVGLISNFPGRVGEVKGKLLVSQVV
jgi:hypothetical protein